MNKTELIEHIAKHADISKAAAHARTGIDDRRRQDHPEEGQLGFAGRLRHVRVGKRAARSGRNPRTGAAIKIKAAKVPKFRPGKALKDALN